MFKLMLDKVLNNKVDIYVRIGSTLILFINLSIIIKFNIFKLHGFIFTYRFIY